MEFKKFNSIEQFKNVIFKVKDNCNFHGKSYPKITFNGTVKLHGTNLGIGFNTETKELIVPSKEQLINKEVDNLGSAKWAYDSIELKEELNRLSKLYPNSKEIYLYGEWAGPGIFKNNGINKIKNKSYFIFSVIIDDEKIDLENIYIKNKEINQDRKLFYIDEFPKYKIEIDFNYPEIAQNKLVEITKNVELECPVAKAFGFSGTGEGVVWSNMEKDVKFKVKGPKHSATKVKEIKEIASVDILKYEKIIDFVNLSASENRLEQGLTKLVEMQLNPLDIKNMGEYIRWVVSDILKEEEEEIKKSDFNTKNLGASIAKKARDYFIKNTEKLLVEETSKPKKLKN